MRRVQPNESPPRESAIIPAMPIPACVLRSLSLMVAAALADIAANDPTARVLICGSLYLAGHILRENA